LRRCIGRRKVICTSRLEKGQLVSVVVGVMAQEVALIHPDAVVHGALDDYLRVDYGRLGLKLMTLPKWDARSEGERL
jgi:hypothetical protein